MNFTYSLIHDHGQNPQVVLEAEDFCFVIPAHGFNAKQEIKNYSFDTDAALRDELKFSSFSEAVKTIKRKSQVLKEIQSKL